MQILLHFDLKKVIKDEQIEKSERLKKKKKKYTRIKSTIYQDDY